MGLTSINMLRICGDKMTEPNVTTPDLQHFTPEQIKENEMELSASEAVYGFCAWLTTQPGIIKMGASENYTPVLDAVGVFCKENNLPEPRDGWEKVLKHPPVALSV